jgi:hypothetical protein
MTARVFAPELFEPRRRYRNPAREAFLRQNVGIDPAVLAMTLGVTERFVRMLQRKLGLRKCRGTLRKGEVRE